MDEVTTIQIRKETRRKVKSLAASSDMDYDSLLNDLVEERIQKVKRSAESMRFKE